MKPDLSNRFSINKYCYVQKYCICCFTPLHLLRTAERTVYMILNLSWVFFLTLEGSTSLWKQFLQLCFQPAKNVLYITLTCCPPHSIVLIVLFSDLYLCLETVTFWIKINLQYVVCFISCNRRGRVTLNDLSVIYLYLLHVFEWEYL